MADFFYCNGLAFNVVDSQSFKDMVDAIATHGPGYAPPSSFMLRTSLLDESKAAVVERLEVLIFLVLLPY